MANSALKGSTATTLLVSSLLKATRAVIYTEPTDNAQLARHNQITNAFAIADSLISACNRRDSTSIVTNPLPES